MNTVGSNVRPCTGKFSNKIFLYIFKNGKHKQEKNKQTKQNEKKRVNVKILSW